MSSFPFGEKMTELYSFLTISPSPGDFFPSPVAMSVGSILCGPESRALRGTFRYTHVYPQRLCR